MRSLIFKAALAVFYISAQLPAAFAGPQSPPGRFEGARHSVERPGRAHDRMNGQTKLGLPIEANSLPAYLATLRRLHATDGHIEPQD